MRAHVAKRSFGRLLLVILLAGVALGAEQAPEQMARDVDRALEGERDLRQITVSVEGQEVTLRGRVPTFWAKSRAIKKTLEVTGVETVVSELEVPAVEDDEVLGQEIVKVILNYTYYTMWDFVQVSVTGGVVTLMGSVTPGLDKVDDLFERVAKIPGVQDVQTTIERQPVSRIDSEIRSAIASRIFSNAFFSVYARSLVPPFHIIVHHQAVRLVGTVRDQAERRVMEQIVRGTFGVLSVTNELQVTR